MGRTPGVGRPYMQEIVPGIPNVTAGPVASADGTRRRIQRRATEKSWNISVSTNHDS